MKNIIGKLPVNQKYQVIDISYSDLENSACACDNCGKIISNITTIKNESGAIFNVGLDCAVTMQLYKNDQFFNILEAKKILARRARFVKWYKIKKRSTIKNDDYLFFFDHLVSQWTANYTYRMPLEYFKKTYPFLKI